MTTPVATPVSGRLPLWTRALYGSGDWSMSSFNTFRQVFYAAFLTDVVGLDPRLASVAALCGVVWDAINDPIVGLVSDRLRTSWGRRRPLMLAFAVPFGLAFVGLWWAPPWTSQVALAVHVAVAYMLTDTLQSLVTVPFLALTPELTPDYDERTALTAWRTGFNLAASLAVAVAAPAIVDAVVAGGATAQQGYLVAAAAFGALGAVPPLAIGALLREPLGAEAPEPPPLGATLRAVWENVPFRSLTALYLFNWITFDLVGLMIPFFVRWCLAGGDGAAAIRIGPGSLPVESAMLGLLLVVSLPAVPLWSAVSRRYGKRAAYAIAMSGWVVVQLVVGFVPANQFGLAVAAAAACGLGVSAAHVIPDAMLPEVIDEDELRTGRRNEGAYYGGRNLFRKLAGALSVFGALQVLGWAGYVSSATPVEQPASALLAIRLLVGPAGAVLLGAAIACATLYPITRARSAEIRAALAARRAG